MSRPIGVTSKNDSGARKIRCNKSLCKNLAAPNVPRYSDNDDKLMAKTEWYKTNTEDRSEITSLYIKKKHTILKINIVFVESSVKFSDTQVNQVRKRKTKQETH